MGNYKIKVNMEIVECADGEEAGECIESNGSLAMTIGENIRNREVMEKLVGYLQRNSIYIPCYPLRKKLGLRNGSGIGEKMNDLIVSNRQKHNGMSWSKNGSVALAMVTALKRNNESDKWFREKKLNFQLAA